jgi:hypothetical protein
MNQTHLSNSSRSGEFSHPLASPSGAPPEIEQILQDSSQNASSSSLKQKGKGIISGMASL